jgi:hypothetical protein
VVIYPKNFKKPVLPYVLFRVTEPITGGRGDGVKINDSTTDPSAAGISLRTGTLGVLARNGYGELWFEDVNKFQKSKGVVLDLFAAKRFRITCAQMPPVPKAEYLRIPAPH